MPYRIDTSQGGHTKVQSYLKEKGWTEAVSKDQTMKRFTRQEGDQDIHLFFTVEPEQHTRKIEIQTAVSTLSQIYRSSASNIANIIFKRDLNAIADIINTIVPDYYVKNETVTLKTASAFMKTMRDFLASAATTEVSGQNSFIRNIKSSTEYADNCRFAHTFKGSFGFKIESPLERNAEEVMPFIEKPVPQSRKVVNRIQKSFFDLQNARQSQSVEPLISSNSSMSSNMCDDIVRFVENTGLHKVKFSFEFSPEWESPPQGNTEHQIEANDVAILKKASLKIKGNSKPEIAKVFGMVSKLSTSGSHANIFDESAKREIVINWDSSDYGHIKVKVPLELEQYRKAVQAHHDGIQYLAFGRLSRLGRSWSLTDIQEARPMK